MISNRLFNLFSLVSLSLIACLLSACEPEFAGKRSKDLNQVNDPYRMRIVTIDSVDYLGLINADGLNKLSTGSLQFYKISGNPAAPELIKGGTFPSPVEIPNNVSDFFVDGSMLYIPDRNQNRVLFYERTSSGFAPKLGADGAQIEVTVGGSPERVQVFTHHTTGARLLAVLCKTGKSIYFINLADNSLYAEAAVTPASGDFIDVLDQYSLPGAGLYMKARKTQSAKDDDRINISILEQNGFGIGELLLLEPTGDQIFVAPVVSANAVFSFNLLHFQDRANLTWDLPQYQDGRDNIKGSGEAGFRGAANDLAGTVYLSNRTDNSVYAIPKTEFTNTKEVGKLKPNTTGYNQDSRNYRLDATFDSNLSDDTFPRLSAIATDCTIDGTTQLVTSCPGTGGTAASQLFVVGLASQLLYKVNLSTSAVSTTAAGVLGTTPQKLVYYATGGVIYVSNLDSNTISIVNASDLSLAGKISN